MNNKSVKCPECGKTVGCKRYLSEHLKTHSVNRSKFKCSFDGCNNEYLSRYKLKIHTQIVHLGTFKKIGCSFCNSTFTSKFSRDNHIVTAHTCEKAYKCEECPTRFSTAANLQSHRTTHSDHRPYKCLICFKQFKWKLCLKGHMVAAHSLRKRTYSCSICQKAFFNKNHLKTHEYIHRPDANNFSCYFCKKKFRRKYYLELHTRTHTQEKPYTCSVDHCKYSTAQSTHLTCHLKTHEGETEIKTSSCYFCSKTYKCIKSLVTHIRSHTVETPFTCGLCQKKFKNQHNLNRHIYSHTMEKPFKFQECQKGFVVSTNLHHHIRAVHKKEKRFH